MSVNHFFPERELNLFNPDRIKIEYGALRDSEPATPSGVRTNGRMDSSVDDDTLETLIMASRRVAESYLYRAIPEQNQRLYLNSFPSCEIRLPNPPLRSVSSVQYKTADGWQTLSSDSYTVHSGDVGSIRPLNGSSFPNTLDEAESVRIDYVAGYGSGEVPAPIRHAITILATLMYDSPLGCSEIPNGVRWLLDTERPGHYF
jgi:uncharacterized phiE125 gp8 family phage protein